MRARYRLLVVLLLLTASAALAQGDEGAQAGRSVGTALVSPDGDFVAYTVVDPADSLSGDVPARRTLHVYRLRDGADRVLPTADIGAGSLRWVPPPAHDEPRSGQHVLSYLARGADDRAPSLYTVEVETGVIRRAVGFDTGIADYAWHEDGERIAFIADAPPLEDARQWPVYVTEAYGTDPPRVIEVGGNARDVAWHPGDLLAVVVEGDRAGRQRIAYYDGRSGEAVGEVNYAGTVRTMAWSPSGARLAFIGTDGAGDPTAGHLYVAGEAGGVPRDLLPDLPGRVTALEWLDEDTLGYVAVVGDESETAYGAVEADGSLDHVIIPPDGVVYTSASANAGGDVVALVGHAAGARAELFLWTQDDRQPRQLTHVNP